MAPRALAALVTQKAARESSELDIARVIMGIAVVSVHCPQSWPANSAKIETWVPCREICANLLGFALSAKLQGPADHFFSRLTRRWTRQLPLKLAMVLYVLVVLRGLFTAELDPEVWTWHQPISRKHAALSDLCSETLKFYATASLGVFSEFFEPPEEWMNMLILLRANTPTAWFFRVEATLWAYVVFWRCFGTIGWLVLTCTCVMALHCVAESAELFYPVQAPMVFFATPAWATAYIAASAWIVAAPSLKPRIRFWIVAALVGLSLSALYQVGSAEFACVDGISRCTAAEYTSLAVFLTCWTVTVCATVLEHKYLGKDGLPATVACVFRVLSRLTFGICCVHLALFGLLWTGFGLDRVNRDGVSVVPAYFVSVLGALFAWVFVQYPAERCLSSFCDILSKRIF
eukprot:TRINITY_DN24390_c0_g1_i2.p1 TRINITY_DN24390_c0_g1~~TRINITY_DN24390_c0_g1_i2.p1  ORF type:complete len:468 (+),score=46.48 TRINITY_DN24390_c0_g1_i2:193-1404(+)